ncbi:hypothetical protein [Haliangium sp.]|uniref:hypothetical protein n=1 Tax=Haliangium sp. TaxID=2663208 RepID=UPI003D0BE45C
MLESNVEDWRFRRYQQLLDVEVWVPKNPAVGHTATYVRKDAEHAGRLDEGDLTSAFVTRYDSDRGIVRALVEFARRLDQDGGYEVEVRSLGGVEVISVSGQGEAWALWHADRHVVKIGGRGLDRVPEELVEAYGERYPSQVDDELLDRPLPPADAPATEEAAPAYDPDNPTPDWEEYQPEGGTEPAPDPQP